ncbi:MAG: sulfatase-like hydrolase/transferase [Chitinophagaceae bacterium]
MADFIKKSGYDYHNLSIFESNAIPNAEETHEFFSGWQLLNSPTLVNHLISVLRFKLVNKRKIKIFDNGAIYVAQKNNELVIQKTIELSKAKTISPRFVYSHLVMPHFPYYFDEDGKPNSFEKLVETEASYSKKDYLEYLKYANKKFIKLIDEIQKNSIRPPVIILMSDHGFRELSYRVDKKYLFSNLISICLPNSDYSKFYDGMSNVNFFRAFLNTQFGQTLPLLKDSTIFLQE